MRTAIAAATVATILAGAGLASADTVRAQYSATLNRQINITRAGDTSDVTTVLFNWERSDNPGPGVDALIGHNFPSYCIELTQHVSGGQKYTYDVLQPSDAGLSGFQEIMLERLWGSFFPAIDTELESASFQACVWEIKYDPQSMDIRNDNFVVNNPSGGVRDLAQQWLDAITDPQYSGPAVNVVVLHNAEAQDQVTQVPAPATAGLGLLALAGAGRRRRA
jgi:uncharacterized protein (TIGR03382 family)